MNQIIYRFERTSGKRDGSNLPRKKVFSRKYEFLVLREYEYHMFVTWQPLIGTN